MTSNDTIAAIATVGIVRISGPDVQAIAEAITGQVLSPRQAQYGPFFDAHRNTIDEGLAIRFVGPHSYTGEDVLELQGHGGPVVLDMVLSRVLECGARPARPGEFTERAFLNDKMDLAQAEAVADLIDASSQAAAQAAVRSLDGEFSRAVDAISEELMNLRAWLEAALDFSEEEIDFLSDPALQDRVNTLLQDFDVMFSRASQGSRLTDGLTVVIAGVANVGKSSLLNALAGSDRAIVTDIAGTTRDVLREEIVLEGMPIHVIDTAGIRLTDDVVEQQGVERAHQAVATADHVLVLVNAENPELPELDNIENLNVPLSLVINKIDKPNRDEQSIDKICSVFQANTNTNTSTNTNQNANTHSVLRVSVKRGDGMDSLRAHLVSLAGRDQAIEGVFSARRRHLDALSRSRDATDAALARLQSGDMPELAAEELKLARQALDEVTGRFDTEDLLGKVFGQFCIGK